MIPHIELSIGRRYDDALIAILAVLVADGRVTVGGNWHRLDEIEEQAAAIKGTFPNPLDDTRLWNNS